jgi:hypothetical protein
MLLFHSSSSSISHWPFLRPLLFSIAQRVVILMLQGDIRLARPPRTSHWGAFKTGRCWLGACRIIVALLHEREDSWISGIGSYGAWIRHKRRSERRRVEKA